MKPDAPFTSLSDRLEHRRSGSATWTRLVLGPVLIFAIVLVAGKMLRAPHSFHGRSLESPQPALDLTLTSHRGQPASLSDYRGRLVLLYFGDTACPEVCPTTLTALARARRMLDQRAGEVQVVMVTVDPERDTVAALAEYMPRFDPSFVGLTGAPEEITKIANYYGIFFQRQESESELGYLVDHTATTTLIDREGFSRLTFHYGTRPEDLAADLASMLKP